MRGILLLLLLSNFLPRSGYGAISKLSSQLQQQSKKVKILRSQIIDIESSLTKKNRKYIVGIKRSETLSLELQDLRDELSGVEYEMLVERDKISVILKNYMMRSLDEAEMESSSNLYLDQVMLRGLLKKREKYKDLRQELFR